MALTSPIRCTVKQGQPAIFTSRVRDLSGNYIQQVNLSAINYNVYDLSSRALIGSGSISIPGTVSDALLQNAVLFPNDSTGYNFSWASPQTAFPSISTYRVEFVFTQSNGLKFSVEYWPESKSILSAPL